MKKNLLILICISFCLNIFTMEPPVAQPTQEIPSELQLKYREERERFRKYDLTNSEKKFLPLLRTQLNKEERPFAYLDLLHVFANLLLAQHFMLNMAADVNYLNSAIVKKKEEEKCLFKEMGGRINPNNPKAFEIYPPTIDALNEIYAHKSLLLKSSELLTPQELQTIFNWGFDDRFGPWMKLLSRNRILVNIVLTLKNQRESAINNVDNQLNEILEKLESYLSKLPQLIQQNTRSIPQIYEAHQLGKKRYLSYEKGKQLASVKNSLWDDYIGVIAKEGYLYQYTHPWYQQLYKLIRAEIAATIGQLIKSNPAKLKEITYNASNVFLNLTSEKILPQELPVFKQPAQTIILPSLDKEKAEAKKIWDKQQEEKEITRKKNTKINQTPDGSSYIFEFEDTPSSLTIHNTKNNTQEIIFKHEHPFEIEKSENKIPPINYTNWVQSWFKNPQKALEQQGYLDPQNKNKFTASHLLWKPIVLHAFSPLVDEYIKQWGNITTTKNRRNPAQQDLLITIPGKIIYPSGSQPAEEAGIFAYIIDSKNGQWYHRMFTPGTLSELNRNLFEKGYFAPEMKGYYDVFFPPLSPTIKP